MQTHTNRVAFRFANGLAVTAACLLIWLSLGVGIIGKDDDPANMMYFGVIAVGIIGAIIFAFSAHGNGTHTISNGASSGISCFDRPNCRIRASMERSGRNYYAEWDFHRDVYWIGLAI